MKILFCPVRSLAQRAAAEPNCVAVISSSGEPVFSRLPQIPYVFRQYEDLDMEVPGRSFSEADANAFAAFIRQLGPEVKTVFCCCDAAKSRSPAVAAAICRFFGQSDLHIWKDPYVRPNMLVFDMLTRALGVPVSDEEIDMLLYESQKAFREAIRAARGGN